MLTIHRLTRRTVLTMLMSLTAFGRSIAPASATPKTGKLLWSLLAPVSGSAAHLGRVYLAQQPGQATAATLLRALERDIPGLAETTANGQVRDTWNLLRANIVEDYGTGRVAELDGWVVSRTEARLCALHAVDGRREPAATS